MTSEAAPRGALESEVNGPGSWSPVRYSDAAGPQSIRTGELDGKALDHAVRDANGLAVPLAPVNARQQALELG